jgi:hypothetical protein
MYFSFKTLVLRSSGLDADDTSRTPCHKRPNWIVITMTGPDGESVTGWRKKKEKMCAAARGRPARTAVTL